MSLNGLPGVAPPSRVEPTTTAPQNMPAPRPDRTGEAVNTTYRSAARGSGGLADAMALTFQQLGLTSSVADSSNSDTDGKPNSGDSQSRADLGRLMQAVFQAVQTHSPPLTGGESSSFAAALASLRSQMASGDTSSSLQAALNRVLQDIQNTQPRPRSQGTPEPTVQDLLSTLQRNLEAQTNVVHTKGNVLNARA